MNFAWSSQLASSRTLPDHMTVLKSPRGD